MLFWILLPLCCLGVVCFKVCLRLVWVGYGFDFALRV